MTERQIILAIIKDVQCYPDDPKIIVDKYMDILKEYKSGSDGKEPFHMLCRRVWETYYLELDDSGYYFSPKDASNLNALIKKFRFKLNAYNSGKELTAEEFMGLFDRFIRSSYQVGQTERAFRNIKDHFTISNLNSKFNELFTKIREQHIAERNVVDGFKENMRSNPKADGQQEGPVTIDDFV